MIVMASTVLQTIYKLAVDPRARQKGGQSLDDIVCVCKFYVLYTPLLDHIITGLYRHDMKGKKTSSKCSTLAYKREEQ